MPTSLMGLSPQEISQISSGRRATEADQMRQLQTMLSSLGKRRTADINQQELDLAREKFEYEKNPPMIQMKTEGGQIYEIPRAAQAEGIKAKAYVDNLYQSGKIDKTKHDAWMKPVIMSIPDGAGGWTPYEFPSGMLQETAVAIKNIQEMGRSATEETRKREAFEALGGQKMGDIKDVSMATLLGIRPEAMSTMITEAGKIKSPTEVAALKPEERRKLIKDHTENAFKMLEEKSKTTEASIQSYNDQSKSLGYPSMMFRYSKKPMQLFGVDVPLTGEEDLIEVKLPIAGGVQMIPEHVYASAEQKGISVSGRLQEIYEGMKIIEQARQRGKN